MVIVAVVLFVSFDAISISANVNNNSLLNQFGTSIAMLTPSPLTTFLVAIIAAGSSGIPLGYIIHELYYYIKWNSPISKGGLLPPLISGWENALVRVCVEVDPPGKIEEESTEEDAGNENNFRRFFKLLDPRSFIRREKDKKRLIDEVYKKNIRILAPDDLRIRDELANRKRVSWHYITELVEAVMISFSKDTAEAELRINKYENRIDRMHSLGASHLGFSIGFGIYLILKLLLGIQNDTVSVYYIFGALLLTLITMTLLSISFDSKGQYAEIFIATLLFLSWSLNPNVLSLGILDSDDLPKIQPGISYAILGFCLILILLWIIARHNVHRYTAKFYIESGSILLLFIISIIISQPASSLIEDFKCAKIELLDIEWTIIQSILIYCAISVAFTKNRAQLKERILFSQISLLKEYIERGEQNASQR